ncbi:hypothetical protein [Streptomyces microflavus]|uniref:hypothetical protein n=1 Tax=Streptomyces microflavus TaxID=1919 RepID=UPI00380AC6C2
MGQNPAQKAAKAAGGQQPKKRPGKAQREAIKRAQAARKKAGGGNPAAKAAFHERARNVGSVNYKLTVATTTLPLLTKTGAGNAVWRVVGNHRGEERRTLAALPKAR